MIIRFNSGILSQQGGGSALGCTQFNRSSTQFNNSSQACAGSTTIACYIDIQGSGIAVGDIIYTVDGCTSAFDGNNKWWKLDDGLGTTYAAQVANNTGVINTLVTC